MADLESKGTSSHIESSSAQTQPAPQFRKFGNPTSLGLFSFASTLLILSLLNAQARGVLVPNVVVGMVLACGGLTQLLAGMWEFACGNTFEGTAFILYSGFWISFGLIYIPGTGILAAYEASPAAANELHDAMAFYLTAWFIITFFMWLGTLRATVTLSAAFFFLLLTFLTLMIGDYTQDIKWTKAGGGFGIITAFIAYYIAASGIVTRQTSYFSLPNFDLPKRD